MPSRKEENQLIAREKALNSRVYVSGLKSKQNLETGLAYVHGSHLFPPQSFQRTVAGQGPTRTHNPSTTQ
jgi:hypothetical protein